jgi:nucleotide-binding universal stress UspA family protein
MKTIVVGVDGSPGSQVAVEFAAREAAAHGAALRLISAWEIPTSVLAGGGVPSDVYDNFAAEARKRLQDAADQVRAIAPAVTVEQKEVESHAGNALVEESETADLVVIGRRGHGGLTEFLLGSISHQVADHAKCAVVIVPPAGVSSGLS